MLGVDPGTRGDCIVLDGLRVNVVKTRTSGNTDNGHVGARTAATNHVQTRRTNVVAVKVWTVTSIAAINAERSGPNESGI